MPSYKRRRALVKRGGKWTSVRLRVWGRLLSISVPNFLFGELKSQFNLPHSPGPHVDHSTCEALRSLEGGWAELWSPFHLEEASLLTGPPLRRVWEPGDTSAVPDLDKQFLPGMEMCFSHQPISSLFIPTVVAVEWKVMYSKAIL